MRAEEDEHIDTLAEQAGRGRMPRPHASACVGLMASLGMRVDCGAGVAALRDTRASESRAVCANGNESIMWRRCGHIGGRRIADLFS